MPSALLLLFIIAPYSRALINCPPRNALIDSGRALIKKVAYYDDIKQQDADTFADKKKLRPEQLQSRFAGTGVFGCETAVGNGQVVVKGNIVTTVLHTFLKDKLSCGKRRDLNRCAFMYKDGANLVLVYAKKIISSGECKPGHELEAGDDWAIIELEKSLPKKFIPYKIPASSSLHPGDSVDLVGRTSGFNPTGEKKALVDLPQSYSSCVAIAKDTFKFSDNYQSNCPSQPGSSGAGVFTSEDVPRFSGLMLGDMHTDDLCVPQVMPESADGPFERNCRGSLIVPVEGKYLKALEAIK